MGRLLLRMSVVAIAWLTASCSNKPAQPVGADSNIITDSPRLIDASPDGGISAACTACMSTSCTDNNEYTACANDTSCTPLLGCWEGCGSYDGVVSPCEMTCGATHTTAIAQASTLGDCAARRCTADCPWAIPLGVCDACLFAADPVDVDACFGDVTCIDWYACVKTCDADDITCFNACGPGDAMSEELLTPLQGTCETACQIP